MAQAPVHVNPGGDVTGTQGDASTCTLPQADEMRDGLVYTVSSQSSGCAPGVELATRELCNVECSQGYEMANDPDRAFFDCKNGLLSPPDIVCKLDDFIDNSPIRHNAPVDDPNDPDDDDDGILDVDEEPEPVVDVDHDGIADPGDLDDDNDTVPDTEDADDDNDGVDDTDEGGVVPGDLIDDGLIGPVGFVKDGVYWPGGKPPGDNRPCLSACFEECNKIDSDSGELRLECECFEECDKSTCTPAMRQATQHFGTMDCSPPGAPPSDVSHVTGPTGAPRTMVKLELPQLTQELDDIITKLAFANGALQYVSLSELSMLSQLETLVRVRIASYDDTYSGTVDETGRLVKAENYMPGSTTQTALQKCFDSCSHRDPGSVLMLLNCGCFKQCDKSTVDSHMAVAAKEWVANGCRRPDAVLNGVVADPLSGGADLAAGMYPNAAGVYPSAANAYPGAPVDAGGFNTGFSSGYASGFQGGAPGGDAPPLGVPPGGYAHGFAAGFAGGFSAGLSHPLAGTPQGVTPLDGAGTAGPAQQGPTTAVRSSYKGGGWGCPSSCPAAACERFFYQRIEHSSGMFHVTFAPKPGTTTCEVRGEAVSHLFGQPPEPWVRIAENQGALSSLSAQGALGMRFVGKMVSMSGGELFVFGRFSVPGWAGTDGCDATWEWDDLEDPMYGGCGASVEGGKSPLSFYLRDDHLEGYWHVVRSGSWQSDFIWPYCTKRDAHCFEKSGLNSLDGADQETCDNHRCKFPFVSHGKTYSGCTSAGRSTMWCPVIDHWSDGSNANDWGDCSLLEQCQALAHNPST